MGNVAATIVYILDQERWQVTQAYTVPGFTPGIYDFTVAFDAGKKTESSTSTAEVCGEAHLGNLFMAVRPLGENSNRSP